MTASNMSQRPSAFDVIMDNWLEGRKLSKEITNTTTIASNAINDACSSLCRRGLFAYLILSEVFYFDDGTPS